MIEKTATAFICEHCGKKQFAKGSMRRHEKRCTANPGRECKMCGQVDAAGLSTNIVGLARLVEILSDREAHPKARMDAVRAETDCPACILAAIRQSGVWAEYKAFDAGIGDEAVFDAWHFGEGSEKNGFWGHFLGFDFKEEKEKIFAEVLRVERENHPGCY